VNDAPYPQGYGSDPHTGQEQPPEQYSEPYPGPYSDQYPDQPASYDPYGSYQQQPQQQIPHQQQAPAGWAADPYGTGYQEPVYQDQGQYGGYPQPQPQPQPQYQQQPQHQGRYAQQPGAYGTGQQVYDPYQGPGYDTGYQQPVPPEAAPPQETPRHDPPRQGPPGAGQQRPGVPRPRQDDSDPEFAFVDEADEESEEVIDWLKFSESRTERRDERKRRARNRVVGLLVVVALLAVGAGGYLWKTGRVLGGGHTVAAAGGGTGGRRHVIVVNLRPVDSDETASALLVSNTTTKHGTTVLLPNSLEVNTDDGTSTTLGKSVLDGAAPTQDGLSTLLGTTIDGTWRLDTPYLEILVQTLGGITVDTDATVRAGKKHTGRVEVTQGKAQDLGGQQAVEYATYRAPGEPQTDQLARFGQVLRAVLMKMPSDASLATKTVESMGAIPDPSLSDKQLGASLAVLADQAKSGDYSTTTLPVRSDGTLSTKATDSVVKDVLGGAVKNASTDGTPRISVRNATGNAKEANDAQAAVVNAGYTFVSSGTAPARATSQVLYGSAGDKATAAEVAKTLDLPASAVRKGTVAANADITVVLGADYTPQS
jgi:anionic cell wall polymer biosynthesis LytR-Cps2A-Psr (LCP) family protein